MKYPLITNNILKSDLQEVIKLLSEDNPILTNGPRILEFEKQWCDWLDVKYSVFVNSGSSANLLSMSILKLDNPDGGEVIVPPLTWVSDIASVIQCGFDPVFVDIDLETLGMNTDEIIAKTTKNTKAIFLSHIQGFNALDDKLLSFTKDNNIMLIEDVCESHGASFKNKKVGSYGFMSNFSFYYAHHMSTIEGGMICTNDEETYQKLRMLRSHGMVREANNDDIKNNYIDKYPELNEKFIFAFPAYNFRNTEIGGALGISQLKRLDDNIKKRNENFKYFLDKLDDNLYFKNFELAGSSNYAFNLILNNKDEDLMKKIMQNLDDNKIEFRKGSAGGGNQLRQPYLKDHIKKIKLEDFPNTEHVHFYGMYIGNYPELNFNDIDFIVNTLNQS